MPRKPGCHLTHGERCQISSYIRNGFSQRATANFVGVSQSVVCRELERNSVGSIYDGDQAQKNSELRRSVASSRPHKMTVEVIELIKAMLSETDASPEQISGRLAREHSVLISHEAIYQFIWKDKCFGGKLYEHLRHGTKPYNRRSGKNAGRGHIPDRVDIDQRPMIVEMKERFGDIELDTIVGALHQGAIMSAVDRASKLTWLAKVERGTAALVSHAIISRLGDLADQGLIHTTTSDNGSEFSRHVEMARALGCKNYFATPYHSWERGLNEHTNGLVRQYFPKGTDFTKISQSDVLLVENKLNNRPRKILDFMTPIEFAQSLVSKKNCDLFAEG